MSSLPNHLFGKEKMQKTTHRWEIMIVIFCLINYIQTLSLTGQIWKKIIFWKTFYLHLFVNISIFIYACLLYVSITCIKCTSKKKVPFLHPHPRQTDFSFLSFNLIKQVFCKAFPQYSETVIFIWWFPLWSKLQYMVVYFGSNGTAFKVLILCHLKLILSFFLPADIFAFWWRAI